MKVKFYWNNNGFLTTSCTINRGVSNDSSCKFWKEAWNTQSRFCADGSHVGYNNGCEIIKGNLVINLVSKSEADSFRDFLTNTIQFIRPMAIMLDEAGGADLGRGAGSTLYECYIDGDASTENIIEPLGRGGKFVIRLPYVCLDLVTIEGSFP